MTRSRAEAEEVFRSRAVRQVAELVEAAEREARQRARAVLVERLEAALLAAAEEALLRAPEGASPRPVEAVLPRAPEAAPPRTAEEAPSRTRPGPSPSCYLYAITRAEAGLAGVPGIDERSKVELVSQDGLAAVVSDVDPAMFQGLESDSAAAEERLAWLAARHDGVIAAAFRQGTVLPMRFATLFPTRQDVARLLRERSQLLWAELERLEGRAEWSCRLRLAQPGPAGPRETVPAEEQADAGTAYLAQRARRLRSRDELRDRQTAAAERVREQLRRHAVDEAPAATPPDVLLGAVYLVDQAQEESFRTAIAELRQELTDALELEVTGPLPPYRFVSRSAVTVGPA